MSENFEEMYGGFTQPSVESLRLFEALNLAQSLILRLKDAETILKIHSNNGSPSARDYFFRWPARPSI